MNVVSETFDKQADFATCQDYYYYPQYSPSITDTYSCHSSYSTKGALPHPRKEKLSRTLLQRGSPLTLENVSKVQLADPYNTPLARYCNEMETPEPVYAPSNTSTRKTMRKPHEDYVLESPRLLPFPYHNDAYFLPTAEHDYPGNCSTTDASSSIVTLSVCTTASRQHLSSNSTSPSFCHPSQRGYQRQLLSSPSRSHFFSPKRYDDDRMSNYSNKRRADSVTPSSPSTMREDAIVPQKKRRSNNKFALSFKRNLLRFKSNSPILEGNGNFDHLPASPSTSETSNTLVSLSTDSMTEAKRYENMNYNTKPASSKNVNRSWFERLWKFIKPNSPSNLKKMNSSLSTAAPTPVWYSQFRCNPPPPTKITLLS